VSRCTNPSVSRAVGATLGSAWPGQALALHGLQCPRLRSCEKINFADFGTMCFQRFTLWATGQKPIFSQLLRDYALYDGRTRWCWAEPRDGARDPSGNRLLGDFLLLLLRGGQTTGPANPTRVPTLCLPPTPPQPIHGTAWRGTCSAPIVGTTRAASSTVHQL
jgi:hypothetical protein